MSTHKYFHAFVYVASFRLGHVSHLSSLSGWLPRHPGNLLFGLFTPLIVLHSPDSLKSSLVYETIANWHRIDWWDSSHPYVCFNRQDLKASTNYNEWQAMSWSTAWHNSQLPCKCDDCSVLLHHHHWWANSASLSLSPP